MWSLWSWDSQRMKRWIWAFGKGKASGNLICYSFRLCVLIPGWSKLATFSLKQSQSCCPPPPHCGGPINEWPSELDAGWCVEFFTDAAWCGSLDDEYRGTAGLWFLCKLVLEVKIMAADVLCDCFQFWQYNRLMLVAVFNLAYNIHTGQSCACWLENKPRQLQWAYFQVYK